MNILHIGGYPPPIGGVSIHVQRLDALCRYSGFASTVLDIYGIEEKREIGDAKIITLPGNKFSKMAYLLKILNDFEADIFHFHLANMDNFIKIAAILLWVTSGRKRVASLHGGFVKSFSGKGRFVLSYLKWILLHFDQIITSNETQKNFLVSNLSLDSKNITITPAFLPFLGTSEEQLTQNILPQVKEFCDRYSTIALATGFCERLYGLHTIVEVSDYLADLDIGIIINIYGGSDNSYLSKIINLSQTKKNLLLTNSMPEISYIAMLNRANIFIRATSDDGDSVAVREAIWFGHQIVATDSVVRPDNVLLFRYEDVAGLAAQIRHAYFRRDEGICKSNVSSEKVILDLYRSIISKQES